MSDEYLGPLNITTQFNVDDFDYQDEFITYRIGDVRYLSGILKLNRNTTAITYSPNTTYISSNVAIGESLSIVSNLVVGENI